MPVLDFSPEERLRASRYHRPRYALLCVDLALAIGVLASLQWAWAGPWHLVDGLGWGGAAAAYAAIVSVAGAIMRVPASFWRDHLQERRYDFSTQGVGGWLADLAKGEAVGLVLSAAFWAGFVGLARLLPSVWPAVAALALALCTGFLVFVAPVVLEPIFNRFRPLADVE